MQFMINLVNGGAGFWIFSRLQLHSEVVFDSINEPRTLGSAYHLITCMKGGNSLWSNTSNSLCSCVCLVAEFNTLFLQTAASKCIASLNYHFISSICDQ